MCRNGKQQCLELTFQFEYVNVSERQANLERASSLKNKTVAGYQRCYISRGIMCLVDFLILQTSKKKLYALNISKVTTCVKLPSD